MDNDTKNMKLKRFFFEILKYEVISPDNWVTDNKRDYKIKLFGGCP